VKTHSLLLLALGIWLGGSLVLTGAVSYNFAGFEDLFARNPRLAQRAGFDPADTAAKKESLLWVHASELNRVFFSAWGRTQLVLGAIALGLAVAARTRRHTVALIALALALAALLHLWVEPQIVELGRQLDFVPRTPPPPQLDGFQRLHGIYSAGELLRLAALTLASVLAVMEGQARKAPA
jgi:hypothetical protein